MSEQKINGVVCHRSVIRAEQIREIGSINALNQLLNDVRNQLQQLYGAQNPPTGHIHVVISVEPLTDSAGGPLMTRASGDQ